MPESLQKIVILHTNDIHSDFEAMPKVASVLAERRSRHEGTPVLTIDCGDHMDRMRMETEGSGGMANIAVMNHSGYHLAVPGNNEGLTFPKHELAELYSRRAAFTVLGSNMKESGTGSLPLWMKAFETVTLDGIRLGFAGMTAAYPDFYSLLGWDVEDPFSLLRRELEGWKRQSDVLIVISHLGFSADKRMAEEFDGIDLILGGHTHHLLEVPLKHRNTTIAGCGKFGQHVGEIELFVNSGTRRLEAAEGRCHPIAGFPDDPRVGDIISSYREESRQHLARTVAQLDRNLEIDWHSESRLGNILAAGIRKWTGSEVGIVNAGQMLQSLLRGPVTKGELLDLCPSPINPCRLTLSGSRIVQSLEEALLPEFTHKPIYGYGFRGKQLGSLCLDGMTVFFEEREEPYHKIKQVFIGKRLLQPDEEVTVGTLDMFTFGIGYLAMREGANIRYYLPEFIRDVMEKELRDSSALDASDFPRWIRI